MGKIKGNLLRVWAWGTQSRLNTYAALVSHIVNSTHCVASPYISADGIVCLVPKYLQMAQCVQSPDICRWHSVSGPQISADGTVCLVPKYLQMALCVQSLDICRWQCVSSPQISADGTVCLVPQYLQMAQWIPMNFIHFLFITQTAIYLLVWQEYAQMGQYVQPLDICRWDSVSSPQISADGTVDCYEFYSFFFILPRQLYTCWFGRNMPRWDSMSSPQISADGTVCLVPRYLQMGQCVWSLDICRWHCVSSPWMSADGKS